MATMNTLTFKIFIVFLCLFEFSAGNKKCDVEQKLLCRKQTDCSSCIRAHACCNWCYHPTFEGVKCDLVDSLPECNGFIEYNKNETQTQNINAENSSSDNGAQITPRNIKVLLRNERAVNISFIYQAARNYPLELYYLADLSYSMRDHIETFRSLGHEFSKSLQNLTKNYKLAFGSFLDKPGMPFALTDMENLINPCKWEMEICNPNYLFKHILNFTHSSDKFSEAVRESQISMNLDGPEGALEAIYQILVCGEKFGWTQESYKLVVLSTDGLLHTAGDGILVGATLRNNGTCMIDYNGEHTAPLQYDYPSLDEIRYLLRKKKVNLIVAVPRNSSSYYLNLANSVFEKEMYVALLEGDSSNILDLVNDGFKQFIRQVEFSANTSDTPNLSVRFFADCNGIGIFEEISECKNIEEYTPINFKAELNLTEWEDFDEETIIIREKSINEEIIVHIETVGSCKCQNLNNNKRCTHGSIDCDLCKCDIGWKGEHCEEKCSDSLIDCINNTSEYLCSGSGHSDERDWSWSDSCTKSKTKTKNDQCNTKTKNCQLRSLEHPQKENSTPPTPSDAIHKEYTILRNTSL